MCDPPPVIRALLLLAVAVLTAACVAPEGTQVDPYISPGIRMAHAPSPVSVLYARECAWCHGAEGEGTERGPNLDGELDGAAYTSYMLESGRMPIDDPYEPTLRSRPSFSDEQIDALAEHVAGFGGTGPDIPTPDPAAGDLSNGEQLYAANCAACHSSTGTGATLATGVDAPSLLEDGVTPVIVAEAVALGPGCRWPDPACGIGAGAMPRFGFSSDQVDDIASYIEYLRSEGDPGGWNLGRLGPVPEGAAAVFLGVGVIVLTLLWIGTREGES